jgi:hypothetical protein
MSDLLNQPPRRRSSTRLQDDFVQNVLMFDLEILRQLGDAPLPLPPPPGEPAPPPPPGEPAPPPPPYQQALQHAQPALQGAALVQVEAPALPGSLAQFQQLQHTRLQAEQAQNWDAALVALRQAEALGRKMVIAEQRRVQAPQEKLAFQLQQYQELAPTLRRVRNSSFPTGGAAAIQKESLSAGREFRTYTDAVAELERAKQNDGPVGVKQACAALITAAEAYLQHYGNDLSERQQNDSKSLRKKQICETGIKAARHLAMAAELEAIGEPGPGNAWTDEKQLRATQLRAQFGFETGMQKGAPLDVEQQGRNTAYWVESTEFGEGGNEKRKNFIFKPINPEDPGTLREATRESVAFATSQLMSQQTGLDLGVPQSSVGSVGGYALDMPGGSPPGQVTGSLQKFERSSGDLTRQGAQIYEQISAGECHRAAISDIAGLNMDRTPQNFLVGRGENGDEPPRLIPIDNGLTLPTPEQFVQQSNGFGGLHPVTCTPGNSLLMMHGTYERFPQDTVDRLALLDPDAIAANMRSHRTTLDQVNPGLNAGENLPDSSIELSRRVLALLKKAAPEMSPGEIMIAISKFAPDLADFGQDVDALAERIIQTQRPLRDAYVQVMTAPPEQRQYLAATLAQNGWGNGAELMVNNPAAALRLAQAGTVNAGQDNPVEVAGNLDMVAILTPKLTALQQEFELILPYAAPGEVAGFQFRLQNLSAPNDGDAAALGRQCFALEGLRTDVVRSCTLPIRGEADQLVNAIRQRAQMEPQALQQFEQRAAFRIGVRPDLEQSPEAMQQAIEGLLWLREMEQTLPPL